GQRAAGVIVHQERRRVNCVRASAGQCTTIACCKAERYCKAGNTIQVVAAAAREGRDPDCTRAVTGPGKRQRIGRTQAECECAVVRQLQVAHSSRCLPASRRGNPAGRSHVGSGVCGQPQVKAGSSARVKETAFDYRKSWKLSESGTGGADEQSDSRNGNKSDASNRKR